MDEGVRIIPVVGERSGAEYEIAKKLHAAPNGVVVQVVDGGFAARLALQADSEMVLKVLPHAAQLVRDLDPTRLQDARRPDPGELEQLRRIECSATQDHLASGPRFPPAGLVPPDYAGRPL